MDITELRRKARYGHRSYVYWTDGAGAFRFAPYGRAGLKAAIIDGRGRRPIFWLDSAGSSNIARSLSFMLHLWRCAGRGT